MVTNVAEVRRLLVSPKSMRHGFGVLAVMLGVSLNLIQNWLGFANIETTAISINLLAPEERQVAGHMW